MTIRRAFRTVLACLLASVFLAGCSGRVALRAGDVDVSGGGTRIVTQGGPLTSGASGSSGAGMNVSGRGYLGLAFLALIADGAVRLVDRFREAFFARPQDSRAASTRLSPACGLDPTQEPCPEPLPRR